MLFYVFTYNYALLAKYLQYEIKYGNISCISILMHLLQIQYKYEAVTFSDPDLIMWKPWREMLRHENEYLRFNIWCNLQEILISKSSLENSSP